MTTTCMRFYVSGKVQGVWFRDSTVQEVDKLGGITGWVRNVPDGRVEVLACGEEDRLALLAKWLQKGPMLARVDSVTSEQTDGHQFNEFTVRYD